MGSKRLDDRIRLAKKINKVLGGGTDAIAQGRAKILGPEVRDDESLPDVELEIDLWLRRLDRELNWLIDVHLKCTSEDGALAGRRKKRDAAAAAVHAEIAHRRKLVDAAHGAGASLRFLNLEGRTRRRAEEIARQADYLLHRARKIAAAGDFKAKGAGTPAEWIAKIEPLYRKLKAANLEASDQTKRVANLESDKKQAFTDFDLTARCLVNLGESYFLLIRRQDLAEHLRHLTRRKTRPGPKPAKKKKTKTGEGSS